MMIRLFPALLLAALLIAPIGGAGAAAQSSETSQAPETLYLELWQPPPAEGAATTTTGPDMLVAIGQPTVSAPIADWCEGLRRHGESSVLPEALLRGAAYDRFATDTVPLMLEVLIDDVEMRYALGTERPPGISFPFFEVCAIGFGSREADGWVLDVLHLTNHRGDSMALGVYKGVLTEPERAYLEAQLGYATDLPDPAGLLLLGNDHDLDTLLLVESPSSDAFDALRARIVR